MQLGNGKWESTIFNSRLQPTQIALAAVPNATDVQKILKLDYTYTMGNADNNGDVLSQTITVPPINGAYAFTATQNYTYHPLNRIESAVETKQDQIPTAAVVDVSGTVWIRENLHVRRGEQTDSSYGSK